MKTIARLYTTGIGKRLYRRASVLPGAGRELVLRADAESLLSRVLPILEAAASGKSVTMAAGTMAIELRQILRPND